MGLFSKRTDKLFAAASAMPSELATNSSALPVGIINTPVPLAPVLFPDWDTSDYPVSESEAMAVPAVKRAISLYTSLSSRFVLDAPGNQTPWLTARTGAITPEMRISYTIRDLIFYNQALWMVDRDGLGTIIDAAHINRGRWSIDNKGLVQIDNKPVNQKDLIWFGGVIPGDGFLADGRHSVRQYTNIARTINNRTSVSEPVTLVKNNTDIQEEAVEIQDAIEDLRESLTNNRGGIVYVPKGIEIVGYGASDNANAMMLEARNACRLDVGNHLNIDPSLLSGTADGGSDTYTNTLLVQNELLELSIKAFTQPIADRLSADDVTPNGVRVEFNYSTFDTAPVDNPSNKGTVPVPNEETND